MVVHWEPHSALKLAEMMVALTAEPKVESMAATKAAMKAETMVVMTVADWAVGKAAMKAHKMVVMTAASSVD